MTTRQTIHRILTEARNLIADPENWTRATLARNFNGEIRNVMSDEATCFCAEGAIQRAYLETANCSIFDGDKALDTLRRQLSLDTFGEMPFVASFNDDPATKHSDVLAAFDRAIAATA